LWTKLILIKEEINSFKKEEINDYFFDRRDMNDN